MLSKNGFKPDLHLYLQHGWGFSHDCFKVWPNHVKQGTVTLLDRGYMGVPVGLDELHDDEYNVLVTHSLGLHYFSVEQINAFDMLVILSGFACFHGLQSEDGIFSRKHVKRMKQRLANDPLVLLDDFYRDCSWSGQLPDKSSLNLDLLSEDLILLDTVVLQAEGMQTMKSIILHGSNDRIVPLARAHELSNLLGGTNLYVIDDAGHGLPFTHPEQCLAYITQNVS